MACAGALQGFQEGIKSLLGEHVDFVNNKNLIATMGREVLDILPEFPNLIDAAVTGAVDFQDIETMPLGDLETRLARLARRRRRTVAAVQGLARMRATESCRPPGAAEEKGVATRPVSRASSRCG